MKSLESYSRLVSVQNLHSSRSKSKSAGSNRSYGSPNASPRLSQKFLGPYHCSPTPSPTWEYQEFDTVEERKRRQPMEGQLCKYTNVMKGWQYRWFSLDPDSGSLEYFEKEEHKKQRPRGALHLAGAVISPSDEDSQTFTVHAANGELYRLRAADARGRQHWVDKLRATAEYHTANLAQNAPAVQTRHAELISSAISNDHVPSIRKSSGDLSANNRRLTNSTESLPTIVTMRSQYKIPVAQTVTVDPFKEVKEYLFQASEYSNNLKDKIGELPQSGQYINGIDKDLLLLKATSTSTVYCLQDCLNILQMRQNALSRSAPNASSSSSTSYDQQHPQPLHSSVGKQSSTEQQQQQREVNSEPSTEQQTLSEPEQQQQVEVQEEQQPTSTHINPHSDSLTADEPSPCESYTSTTSLPYPNPATAGIMDKCDEPIDHSKDVEDEEEYKDTELGAVDEHKSIILHLLSQLKLGMDLTKVVLPTFILEKRSLLEMFADCMAHPLLFLSIPELETPEQRMLAVVEWYLTSFHAGRQGSVAKKPYNPIRGEAFHCSWRIPRQETYPPSPEHPKTENGANGCTDDNCLLTYCAEQVSHHPPISAFYFECPEKDIYMNASIWTKSKFMGMSIGVVMVGKISLNLLKHDEEYVFGLPSAYARSILTVPWVELGDKIYITCQKSGYSAAITFHTKPFYGGKLHRVTAEVKNNNTANIICKVQGEWNSFFEFTYENGETKVIDVSNLEIMRKSVRPISSQGEFESRKLWRHVTNALRLGDVNIATEHKKFLEDRQREGERLRKETNTAFPTKFFHQDGEDWVYKKILKNRHKKDEVNGTNDNVSNSERNDLENEQLEESPSKSSRGSQIENDGTDQVLSNQCGGDCGSTEEEKNEKEKNCKKEESLLKLKKSPKISRINKSEKFHKNEESLKDLVS